MYVCMYISNKLQYQLMFFAGLYRVSLFFFFNMTPYLIISLHFSSRYLSYCSQISNIEIHFE